jgi:hypothetical protein
MERRLTIEQAMAQMAVKSLGEKRSSFALT